MVKVLIVDDEARMLDLIELYLRPYEYECVKARGAEEALDVFDHSVELVLLDIMMPEMDGYTLCRKLRKQSDVPIIMLTARDQTEDIVRGLKAGADDYVTKPFHEEELLARMEALLRRQEPKELVSLKGLEWNEAHYELTYMGKPIKLTPKEFHMIGNFMRHPEQVFSREQLIEIVWGMDADIDHRTVDSHVRNMRDKIRSSGFSIEDHLMTVWGIGYKWTV